MYAVWTFNTNKSGCKASSAGQENIGDSENGAGEWVSQSACFREALHQCILADRPKNMYFFKKGFLISILNPSSSPSMLSNRSLRESQAWELERWRRDSEPLLPLQRIKFSSCKSVQSLKLQFPGIWCPLLGFTGSTCKHTVHLYTHR